MVKQGPALPTIGRVVYFYDLNVSTRPFAALVADAVDDSYMVNLMVINHNAALRMVQSVPHIDIRGQEVQYWDWMPYQKGQAAKVEELQQELDRKVLDAKAK